MSVTPPFSMALAPFGTITTAAVPLHCCCCGTAVPPVPALPPLMRFRWTMEFSLSLEDALFAAAADDADDTVRRFFMLPMSRASGCSCWYWGSMRGTVAPLPFVLCGAVPVLLVAMRMMMTTMMAPRVVIA